MMLLLTMAKNVTVDQHQNCMPSLRVDDKVEKRQLEHTQ